MKKKLLLASVLPAIAAAAFAGPALAATEEAASENWAGYVATTKDNTDYSAVSASWVQPTVTCSSDSSTASYSAYWVGLGGGDSNSDALEQIGTQADCGSTGTAQYYAWYELVPSAPVKLDLTINAGDTVWARTAVNGDQVSFYIKDRTTGQVWQKTLTMTKATPDTSTAEWVAEAPSECTSSVSDCTPLPLADFGTAKFSQAYATSSGKVGSISDSRWTATAIELEPSSSSLFGSGPGGYAGGYGGGTGYGASSGYGSDSGYSEYSSYSSSSSEGAAPTALSNKGTTFSVKYGASLSGDTQSSGTSQTQGEGSSTYGYGGGYGSSSAAGDGYGDGYGNSYGGGYGDSYGYGDTYGYGGTYGYGYYGGGYSSGY